MVGKRVCALSGNCPEEVFGAQWCPQSMAEVSGRRAPRERDPAPPLDRGVIAGRECAGRMAGRAKNAGSAATERCHGGWQLAAVRHALAERAVMSGQPSRACEARLRHR